MAMTTLQELRPLAMLVLPSATIIYLSTLSALNSPPESTDAHLNSYPGPLILRSNWLQAAAMLLIFYTVPIGLLCRYMMGGTGVISLLIAFTIAFFTTWIGFPLSRTVTLDASGMQIRGRARVYKLRWDEITKIESSRGVEAPFSKAHGMVWIFCPSLRWGQISIVATSYGTRGQYLAELLQKWQEKALSAPNLAEGQKT